MFGDERRLRNGPHQENSVENWIFSTGFKIAALEMQGLLWSKNNCALKSREAGEPIEDRP